MRTRGWRAIIWAALVVAIFAFAAGGPLAGQALSSGVAKPVAKTAPAKTSRTTAATEQRFDQSKISLWLAPAARKLGVSTSLLWSVVYWINFAILIYFLYFLLTRMKTWTLPKQMRGRTELIRRRLREAEEARRDAAERLRSIERRLEGLGAEVEAMRASARAEAEAEFARLGAAARLEADHVGRFAEQQIASAAKAARQDLRHYAGELAVAMAETQLRRRTTPEMDAALVQETAREIAARA